MTMFPGRFSSARLIPGGPFDAYCMPSDTGDHSLLFAGLLGSQYRMTSNDSADVADMDPAYGLQLHHPQFLEYVGAPESARLLARAPGHWVQTMDWEDAVAAALQLQHDAGLITSNLQVLCDITKPHVVRGDEISIWRLKYFRRSQWTLFRRCPVHNVQHTIWPKWVCGGLLGGPGAPGLLPRSLGNKCMKCSKCFPGLPK